MPKLFISYRRQDSADVTGRLFDRMKDHFGGDNVFVDIEAIPYGVDFRQHLSDAVARCDVLLAVIGDHWLDAALAGDPLQRGRRLDDPHDLVRIEIEAALVRGIPVIPVLVSQAAMPKEKDLPAVLKDLAYRNAAEVRSGRDFDDHVSRLIRSLERLQGDKRHLQDELQKAIDIADRYPEMSLARARKVLELVVRNVYERRYQEPSGYRSLNNLLQRLAQDGFFPDPLSTAAGTLSKRGQPAVGLSQPHATADEAQHALTALSDVLKWYFEVERPEAVGQVKDPGSSAGFGGPSPAPPADAESPLPFASSESVGTATASPLSVSSPAPPTPRDEQRAGRRLVASAKRMTGKRFVVGCCACITLAALAWLLTSALLRGRAEQTTPPPMALHVKHFHIKHTDMQTLKLGELGRDVIVAHLDDQVTVDVELSKPAYAFLIAFRADGQEDLLFPENDNQAPLLTDRPRYPLTSGGLDYGLNEGTGLWVFSVAISSRALPPYAQWRKMLGPTPWKTQPSSVNAAWYVDGEMVDALTRHALSNRGKGKDAPGRTGVVAVTDWLRSGPEIETAVSLGFAVVKPE